MAKPPDYKRLLQLLETLGEVGTPEMIDRACEVLNAAGRRVHMDVLGLEDHTRALGPAFRSLPSSTIHYQNQHGEKLVDEEAPSVYWWNVVRSMTSPKPPLELLGRSYSGLPPNVPDLQELMLTDSSYFRMSDEERSIVWTDVIKASLETLRRFEISAQSAPSARHSPDFTSVFWFGTTHCFTKSQARAIEVLWNAWENETPTVGQEYIAERIGSGASNFRLQHLFRDGNGTDHKAWGSMIVAAGKGIYELKPPKSPENHR